MRKFFWFSLILIGFNPFAPAMSEGSRMSPIVDNHLMEGMRREGIWDIEISERMIEYRCKNCDPKITARIEALAQPLHEVVKQASETYFARRKRYCARLASDFKGRCISSERSDWRVGCFLKGFKSIQDYRHTRQVVFTYCYGRHDSWAGSSAGPEILKVTIIQEGR